MRQETKESRLDIPTLISVWEEKISKAEQKLSFCPKLNGLVDAIRVSGLRAKLGRERDNQFPGYDFRSWTKRWSDLKSQALVEAIWRRGRGDKKILIARSIDNSQSEIYQERLTFVFMTEPIPYRTSTAVSNLTRILCRKGLMTSLGKSDELPELPGATRFYF